MLPRPQSDTAGPLSKGRPQTHEQSKPPRHFMSSVLTSSIARCPWYDDVIRLSSRTLPPFEAWKNTALLFAGSNAWRWADLHRVRGGRAVTVLPPGARPSAIRWPVVADWVGDAGDLPAIEVLDLVRALIESGARRVQLVASSLPQRSLVARRAAS